MQCVIVLYSFKPCKVSHTILTVKFQESQPGLLASVLPSPPPSPPASPPACPPAKNVIIQMVQEVNQLGQGSPAPPASPPASQPGNCQAYLMTDLELWSWQKVNLAWWQQHSQLSCLQSVWEISSSYCYYHYSHESRGGTFCGSHPCR